MEEVKTFRVYNRCNFDIGIKNSFNQDISIAPGDFAIMNARDIAHAENLCTHEKYFAKRMLVPCDENDNEVELSMVGRNMKKDDAPHLSNDEIETMLKGNIKKMESFLNSVTDQAELYQIVEVAKKMDLTAGKLKVIQARVPNADLLSQYE